MKKFITLSGLIGFSVILTSCIQQEQKTILNPDGSGKFTVEQRMNSGLGGLGALGGGSNELGRSMAVSLLAGSTGVDVWTSAAGAMGADGAVVVRATGYAKDFAKLNFNLGSEDADEKAQGSGSFLNLELKKDETGNIVLEAGFEKALLEAKNKSAGGSGEKPTDAAARKEKRTKELVQMEASMGMMTAMMKDAKISVFYNFGEGQVLEHGCFKLVNPSTVCIEVKPLDMFNGMLAIMKDDELGEIIDKSDSFDKNNPEHQKVLNKMLEAMYGKGGKPRVVIKPKGNAFDYAAEVAKARESQSEELKAMLKEADEKRKKAKEKPAEAQPEGLLK